RKSEARIRSPSCLSRVPSDRDRDSHPFRLQTDREQAGSRTREQRPVHRLAITHPFVRKGPYAWRHSKFSSLDNAIEKAQNIFDQNAASRWRDCACHKLLSFRAKSKNPAAKA